MFDRRCLERPEDTEDRIVLQICKVEYLEEKDMGRKGRKRYYSLLFVVLLILVGTLPVFASENTGIQEEKGTIRLILKDLETENSSGEGVEFGLWKVGTVNENGTPQIDEEYGVGEYPQDSRSLDEAARKMAHMLKEGQKEADRKAATGQGGSLLLDQVEPGVYLLQAGENNPYGMISPFLVQLPYWEEIEGQMEGPVYEVTVEPKASPYPAKPGETPEPDGTGPAAKTGDETSPAGYFLILAVTVLALGAIVVLKRKEFREEKEEGERGSGK